MKAPGLFIRLIIAIAAYGGSHFHADAQLNTNNLTHYTEQNGLPGTYVNSMLIDRFGYVWIATINGLARFDGYNFKRFYNNPNDPGSLKGLVIWSLYEDRKGQIWVSSSPGFLGVYNSVTQSFKHYDYDHLLEKEANIEKGISVMSEDKQGRLYFGVASAYGQKISSALLYLDEQEDVIKRVMRNDIEEINNIYSAIQDSQGNPWFNSDSHLLRITEDRLLEEFKLDQLPLLKGEVASSFAFDKKGHLWAISNFLRIFDINTETKEFNIITPTRQDGRQGSTPTKIVFDSLDNLWIGTNFGLYFYSREDNTISGFNNDSDKAMQSAIITDLVFDSFGSLWIGTGDYGLFRYEETSYFKSYKYSKDDPNSLANGWANNIFETKDGKILVTTSGAGVESGISIIDLEKEKIQSTSFRKLNPRMNTIWGMTEYAPGEFIMNAMDRTYLYKPSDNTLKEFNIPGLPDSVGAVSLFKDSRDNLWVGADKDLYKKSKGSSEFKTYQANAFGGNVITRMVESPKHGLWLLTDGGLFLYHYDTDQIERKGFDQKAGNIFVTQDINSFYEDKNGTAWVGTWLGGLSRYEVATGKIKTYTINDGLPSMSIQSIIADEQNQSLWLSTFEGLSRFDIQEERFYNYSIVNGIQSQLFADGSFLKTSKGDFIFGGSNGITVFNPKDLNKKSIPPKVYITDFKLFNKSVVPGENSILKKPIYETSDIVLEHDQNSISLEFIALHYSNPSNNRYSYILENYDDVWRENVNHQVAIYPNLPPGEYVFKLKATNNNGIWNDKGTELKITVNKPWWNTTGAYTLYSFLFAVAIFGADRYFRHRIVVMERERARTRELDQAKEIEKAYTELKATQSQLIQSEKMASLGELTAGIAHEIQNPLNFVNNFSEVNSELIAEMKEELANGNIDEAKSIANDIDENEKKIIFHGKRADGIVKGMLQHSRSSSGVKEPTDINALADEYLRLAYHGLRAKDKSFNATMKTDFDENVGNILVVPQDIGRVILNLITNAFYAATERKKKGEEEFEPTVSVSTKKSNGKVEIRVKDNGNGIPQKVLDKIFQPFFTTKPAGQGTGLGLSMSYDIVTKAHQGEIKVETKEAQPDGPVGQEAGTEFTIVLPQ